jgi:hypothetical protein
VHLPFSKILPLITTETRHLDVIACLPGKLHLFAGAARSFASQLKALCLWPADWGLVADHLSSLGRPFPRGALEDVEPESVDDPRAAANSTPPRALWPFPFLARRTPRTPIQQLRNQSFTACPRRVLKFP